MFAEHTDSVIFFLAERALKATLTILLIVPVHLLPGIRFPSQALEPYGRAETSRNLWSPPEEYFRSVLLSYRTVDILDCMILCWGWTILCLIAYSGISLVPTHEMSAALKIYLRFYLVGYCKGTDPEITAFE